MPTTQKEIKMKDGTIVPKGSPVTFLPDSDSRCLVQGERPEPYRVRITSAFKVPSMRSLEKYSYDGIAKSVLGKRVEPDGRDEHGSPSWLLVIGVI